MLALAACSPVESWRSLSGVNKNDPDPETTPFSGNLAEGEKTPYPNLATVPPPPTRATSTAERKNLADSLVADRRALSAAASSVAPAPAKAAASTKKEPAGAATKIVSAASTETVGSISPNKESIAAAPAPSAGVAAAAVPAPAPANPIPGATAAGGAAATPEKPSPDKAAPDKLAAKSPQSGRRKAGEPPEPAPPDSNLQMPEIRSVPEPETPRPAPPAPTMGTIVRPPAVGPSAAVIAAAAPQPAPAPPVMAPVPPPPVLASRSEPTRPSAPSTVATIELAGAEPDRAARAEIERVASLYKEKPGAVRVVAYAAASTAGAQALGNYHAALERAQSVAKALTEAGVPAAKIQTEAAPAGAGSGRVEVQFAP